MRVAAGSNSTERGAAMVMVMLAIVALCGAAAFSIDLGNGWQTRRGLITATDAAALAAAQTYAKGGNGCAADAGTYLAQNAPAASLTSCNRTTIGSSGGVVTVAANEAVDAYFGPVVGFNDWSVNSTTSALYGPITSPTGLRPFGLCLAGSSALQAFLANPTTTATITISYTKDHPDDCAPSSKLPGNWGTVDFDGGSNSNADTKEWTKNGYDGPVSAAAHGVTSCSGESHCYEGDTGAVLAGLNNEIKTLRDNGTYFTVPIFNYGEGNGGGVRLHLYGFIQVRVIAYKVNGPEAARFFTFEVTPGLVSGTCCGGGGADGGLRGVYICATDRTDQSACSYTP